MDRVTLFHDVDDASRRPRWIINLQYCLVPQWIERRAASLDLADSETLERRHQRTLDCLYALEQWDAAAPAIDRRILDRRNGAAQIVDDRQQLAREVSDGEISRILSGAICSPADVLGIGQGPKQSVLQ
jgi:hypothetical protein